MTSLKAFTMPKWGIEMSEGTVAEWLVEQGKPFAKGDVLVLIETDKITNEVEAESDGCFVQLVAETGQTLPVGALVAVLGDPAAPRPEIEAFIANFRGVDASMVGDDDKPASVAPEPKPATPPAPAIPDSVAISPAARFRAESVGLDVSSIHGSGPLGRINAQDVERAIRGARSPELKGPIAAPGQEQAFASPLARRIAVQNGIDLASLTGSGKRGRICKADVMAAITPAATTSAAPAAMAVSSAAASSESVEIIPMSSMRRTIAARLTEAKRDIPHFYLRKRVRADRLIAFRKSRERPASINDYLVRAAALALCEVPEVNIQVHANAIHRFAHADIAVAVATPRGLITPIVTAADTLSVSEISTVTADLAQRARAGKLTPESYQGGSFTISNLGMYGIEQFDAIINPPQGAILAVGAASPQPIDDAGAIRIVPVLNLSLSCDHRAIDGADGARFLQALASWIEAPDRL